ncbi:EAL domain-containing protein [Caballeronia sp. BCC1704]|uniref:putative bifunctional diguanylate cyclase/phosphodiesterase n=1 Tax=Caballeronia sp. BCC1704 TaxID=2676300 RepID=UPI001FC82061|nr:EAL domain-containing protein [Caballeronia sp. BCC1704]
MLPHALAAGELTLAYQPVIDSVTRETVGAEALLRWKNNELGDVGPAEFIPIAEKTGFLKNIGDWALLRACVQAARWRRIIAPRLVVSVNVSAAQFDDSLLRHITTCLERTGLEASALQLEITESMPMPDTAASVSTARALSDLGVKLAIDDFGTGYASLSYLKRFRLHNLKIDRLFVADLPRSHESIAITRALIDMAHALDMTVTAEGVETADQATALWALGCDLLQGYLFGRATSPTEFTHLLAQNRARPAH